MHRQRRRALRTLWRALVLCCGLTACSEESSREREPEVLRVAMPPGRIDDFTRVLRGPFEARSDVVIEPLGMRSADQVARLRIEGEATSIDVLWVDFGEAQLLAREGLLAEVSEADVPNLARIRDEARSPSGIAPITFSSALGFLYNTERLPDGAPSWASLWSDELDGELALFDFGSTLGPAFLVVAARLGGGGEDAIDAGFEKLAELSSRVVLFQSSGPANNLLVAQGEAGLTLGLASQALDLKDKGAPVAFRVPDEGAVALPQGFQVARHAKNKRAALEFLDYALSEETQTRLAEELLLVVTNRDVVLSDAVAPLVPLDNIMYLDFVRISAERGAWTDRFNREILAP